MERPVAKGSDEKWERGKKSSERLSGAPPGPALGSFRAHAVRCRSAGRFPVTSEEQTALRATRLVTGRLESTCLNSFSL